MAMMFHTYLPSVYAGDRTTVDYSWRVRTRVSDGETDVWVSNNLESAKHKSIKCHDTFIDNLLGRSWEARVNDTIEKLQRYCDERNRAEAKDAYIDSRLKGSLR